MAQNPRVIDLRRSYLPMDPNAFPPTMHGTENEDNPESRVPIIPYDGYNFMPTPQGYSSFFGTNSTLGVGALNGNVDDVFVIQKQTYENIAVALKDDGIYTKDLSSGGAWTHVAAFTVPPAGVHLNWSRCVIDQDVFVYRQGEPSYWILGPSNSYTFTAIIPSFINMVGQLGLFKAGSRLAFWDSENSIGWSALGDPQDFTPSLETLAGNTIFQDIVGRITCCLQHGTGFIIYCTRSIVHVTRQVESPMLFSGHAIFNNNGISYRTEACFGDPDTQHFVMTTTGLCEISNGQPQFVAPEASRYFKERRQPFNLSLINGKFLFLSFIDPDTGRVLFNSSTEPAVFYQWQAAKDAVTDITNAGADGGSVGTDAQPTSAETIAALRSAEYSRDQIYLNTTYGYTNYLAAGSAQVPKWQNHLVSSVPLADLDAFVPYANRFEPEQYFYDTGFTQGGLTLVDGTTGYFLPTKSPKTAAAFSTVLTLEPNANDFYRHQDALFYYEDLYYQAWQQTVEERIKSMEAVDSEDVVYSSLPAIELTTGEPIEEDFDIGTSIVKPTFYSTRDKYYGLAAKSAWLQRSLVQGIQVKVRSHITQEAVGTVLPWQSSFANANPGCAGLFPGVFYSSYADIISKIGAMAAYITCLVGPVHVSQFHSLVETPGIFGGSSRSVVITFRTQFGLDTTHTFYPIDFDELEIVTTPLSADYTLEVGTEVYRHAVEQRQVFSEISEQVDYNTCVHKELGYTSIIGHGHYTSFGGFVNDNVTPEVPDYVDVCVSDPAGQTGGLSPRFNNVPFIPTAGQGGIDSGGTGSPSSDGVPWYGMPGGSQIASSANAFTYPIGDLPAAPALSIPGFSILFQTGSIEPIYPTFLGAYVFDTHLKKWGKMKTSFKNLFDVYPINTMAGEGIFPFEHFMPKMAIRLANGTFPVLDEFPTDSEIVYGKFGMYRKGYTDLEEILVQHRNYKSGTLRVELSVDGRSVANDLTEERDYTSMAVLTEGYSVSARWFNIIFKGFFDLIALEVRARQTGRR